MGVIYILTNPSFPSYVKIGYADDVKQRLNQLNHSECTPFAFRIYATYETKERLTDLKLHNVIDTLNPNLRSIDNVDGKERVREFYAITAEEAYSIFESIAEISDTECNLHLWKPTDKEQLEKDHAEEVSEEPIRHTQKLNWDFTFSSSLTGKEYDIHRKSGDVLGMYEHETGVEIPNFSNPSKKAITKAALEDLGYTITNQTLAAQLRMLRRHILKK